MMFLTKAEGYTIDQITYQPVTFEKTVPPFNNTILGVLFRATVQYQASEHLGFYVQPAVRLSTRSVYDTDYPIGKELTRFNANIGLQYRF